MPHYISYHHEPSVSPEEVQSRWTDMASEQRAIWVKTWFNHDSGKRYCWWDAPKREALEAVFSDNEVPWEEIIEVEITYPSDWRWRED
ncbi:nickel-binding protein [Thermodesulfobacteriota bacterium]